MFPEELSARLLKSVTVVDPSAKEQGVSKDDDPGRKTRKLSDQALAVAESLRASTISASVLTGVVRVVDAVIVASLGALTLVSAAGAVTVHPLAVLAILAGVVLVTLVFQAADCYQVSVMRTLLPQLTRITIGLSLIFGAFFGVPLLFDYRPALPPDWLGLWFGMTLLALLGMRLGLAFLLRHWTKKGRLEHRAVIVGGGEAAANLIRDIEQQPSQATRICGIFDDRKNDRSPAIVAGYPKLGSVADLVEFARIAHVDMLIVTIPINAERRLLEFLKQLWVLPVDIRLSAHTASLDFRDRASSFIGGVPFVNVVDRPVADWDAIVKRILDLLVASAALILLSPVMLATALAIRLDSPGPILFRQKRYGFNNEVIEVFKFRSMYHHLSDPLAKRVVTKGDSRITRVGRFIRKASIDELPQIFNVLSGELSLVGPRPHAVNAHTNQRLWEQVVDGYFARHKVKPGITGWAQVNGWRGEVDTPEKIHKRVEYDIYYIENWSILLDLYIMFRTPFALFNTENAY
ncbi:MAG: undecaprenyl-phosphate glucose phosphotransferase [Thiocapsa sp.]|uniref:undecaprenyl-phosphate glucose phosphotransferase n=1 Tax=Thiocapsa sp. TaxID=2024551 RepID=UPI001BD0EF8C|nr:undecaprenyl-phosphate glucose phosphotransferase [Thiocapsa sp.]QVL49395.1 MAG: undecaprenyl-phosphate glucose phosphotransferase [Thiocapsa sp.]